MTHPSSATTLSYCPYSTIRGLRLGNLLIGNMTDETWALSLSYRDLGSMPPYERREVNVARKGRLCARRVEAPADTDLLTLALTPAIRAVEISGAVRHGVTMYQLRAIERSKAGRRAARTTDG